MQNLRVGDIDCLTFFDSGANTNLIDRQLVRNEDLQLISSKSTALGVIGGGSIMTEYSSFRFNLRPGNIAEEYKATASPSETTRNCRWDQGSPAPGYQEYTDSAYSYQGSSGVGVYLSPFKDVWGSRIIFAGLSKIFTQGN